MKTIYNSFTTISDCKSLHDAVLLPDRAAACRTIEYLLKNGADINEKSKDQEGLSALTVCIIAGSKSGIEDDPVIKLLLDKGANVNIDQGFFAIRPLHVAVELSNIKLVKLLIEYGADITLRTIDGKISSSHAQKAEIYKFILSRGIDSRDAMHVLDKSNIKKFANNLGELDEIVNIALQALLIDLSLSKMPSSFLEKFMTNCFENIDRPILEILNINEYSKSFKNKEFKFDSEFIVARLKISNMEKEYPEFKFDEKYIDESQDFEQMLQSFLKQDCLTDDLKATLSYMLDDYQSITGNIEGFALWDAYNIYAEENGLEMIQAPVSYKQAAILACDPCAKSAASTIDEIVKFCHEHPVYQNYSYLNDEASIG